MRIDRKAGMRYFLVHVGLLLILLLFPLYQLFMQKTSAFLTGCILHDGLHLYCALCGGTRALDALLHFDPVAALQYNPFVVISLLGAVIMDVWGLTRLLRGKKRIFPIKEWIWIVFCAVMILYMLLRNYLMIAHGYDPCGDLGVFWRIDK